MRNGHTTPAGQPDRRPVVPLSFDDGPDPTWTPRILRVLRALREADAGATFFVITTRVAADPQLIQTILGDGHETTMLASIEPAIRDGGVVLVHDGLGPGARRRGCRETARPIAPLATTIRRRWCEPASLAAAVPPPEPR